MSEITQERKRMVKCITSIIMPKSHQGQWSITNDAQFSIQDQLIILRMQGSHPYHAIRPIVLE